MARLSTKQFTLFISFSKSNCVMKICLMNLLIKFDLLVINTIATSFLFILEDVKILPLKFFCIAIFKSENLKKDLLREMPPKKGKKAKDTKEKETKFVQEAVKDTKDKSKPGQNSETSKLALPVQNDVRRKSVSSIRRKSCASSIRASERTKGYNSDSSESTDVVSSSDEEDRWKERSLKQSELPSEYWHIQKLVKYMKAGNQTATVVALCCLKDHDLTTQINQIAM